MQPHRAYAKINIGLWVLDKREDGYHNLLTAFHRINLFDEITLEDSSDIEIRSSSTAVPEDESNLCYKAARMIRDRSGSTKGVRINLVKNIPVGAGLGGGSSDAATVLRTLPGFWGVAVNEETLNEIALSLGSDVPFFLGDLSAIAEGRGEILEYFPLCLPYTILMCNPRIHVSTAWAYRNVRLQGISPPLDLKAIIMKGIDDPTDLRHKVFNTFEECVFAEFPEIEQIKSRMMERNSLFSLMSGSGSSVFGMFKERSEAESLSREFEHAGYLTSITPAYFVPDPITPA